MDTNDQITDLFASLDIDPREKELHWLAHEFINAVQDGQMPEPWEEVPYGNSCYYHNTDTSETSWEHPLLPSFRKEVAVSRRRAERQLIATHFAGTKRIQLHWKVWKKLVNRKRRRVTKAGLFYTHRIFSECFRAWHHAARERKARRRAWTAFSRLHLLRRGFLKWRNVAKMKGDANPNNRVARKNFVRLMWKYSFRRWKRRWEKRSGIRKQKRLQLAQALRFYRKTMLRNHWSMWMKTVMETRAVKNHRIWKCSSQNVLFSEYNSLEELCRARAVNKEWRTYVDDYCFWAATLVVRVSTPTNMLIRFRNVVSVDLRHSRINDHILASFAQSCPRVEAINLSNTRLSGAGIARAVRFWKALTSVSIRGCKVQRMGCIEDLFTRCSKLTYVDLGPLMHLGRNGSLTKKRGVINLPSFSLFLRYSSVLQELQEHSCFRAPLRTLVLHRIRTTTAELFGILKLFSASLHSLDISFTHVWGSSADVHLTLEPLPRLRRVDIQGAFKHFSFEAPLAAVLEQSPLLRRRGPDLIMGGKGAGTASVLAIAFHTPER